MLLWMDIDIKQVFKTKLIKFLLEIIFKSYNMSQELSGRKL